MEPIEVDPAADARLNQLGARNIGVHDPSTIVKCKDLYWIFITGGGTPSFYSEDLVTWHNGPRTFNEAPSWQAEAVPANRGTGYWAPDVIYHNGKYLLYFSVSTFGRNTSAIGLATNPTLDPNDPAYEWTHQGLVVSSQGDGSGAGDEGLTRSQFNTIDPAVFADQDGRLWLTFGSFWSGIKLIELDPETGLRLAPDSPMYSLADYPRIEAPFIYFHDGYYYLFLNWGRCCAGVNSTYNIRVGRCKEVTGPYLDKDGVDMFDEDGEGGGTLLLETDGAFIGPGHPGIYKDGETYWLGMHFYDGLRRGRSRYALRPLEWGEDGWPVVVTPPAPAEPAS